MTNPEITGVPRTIPFPFDPGTITTRLVGPPEASNLKSGYVRLMPGEAVGLHSTREGEELIIPISGEGELVTPASAGLPLRTGMVAYNPPGTVHDVINTGNEILTYVYVVARPEQTET